MFVSILCDCPGALHVPYKRLIHDLKRNRQTNNRRIENNSKSTTDQSLQLLLFDDQSHHDKTDQSKPGPEADKCHHLLNTLHLTLKMTTAQVVKTSVTNKIQIGVNL